MADDHGGGPPESLIWVAVAQVPYFLWVSIATVLQLSITWMNWG